MTSPSAVWGNISDKAALPFCYAGPKSQVKHSLINDLPLNHKSVVYKRAVLGNYASTKWIDATPKGSISKIRIDNHIGSDGCQSDTLKASIALRIPKDRPATYRRVVARRAVAGGLGSCLFLPALPSLYERNTYFWASLLNQPCKLLLTSTGDTKASYNASGRFL